MKVMGIKVCNKFWGTNGFSNKLKQFYNFHISINTVNNSCTKSLENTVI